MTETFVGPQVIPLTEAPSQTLDVTLNGQACTINVYTKSINVPVYNPDEIVTDPPVYENINPVFLDLYLNGSLLLGGVLCNNNTQIVRDVYFGFVGDLSFQDTQGSDNPYGVPATLPPPDLRNFWQRFLPSFLGGEFPPAAVASKCPGLGTRFLLSYWANIA